MKQKVKCYQCGREHLESESNEIDTNTLESEPICPICWVQYLKHGNME